MSVALMEKTETSYTMERQLEQLAEDIWILRIVKGIEDFKITETSTKFGSTSLVVHKLSFEVDKNINHGTVVMGSDEDDLILSSGSSLMGFLPESLVAIEKERSNNRRYAPFDHFYLNFGGTRIEIEVIAA